MKFHDRDKELGDKRENFMEAATLLAMREVARNPEKYKECLFHPVTEDTKKIFSNTKVEAFMEMDPSPHAYDAFIRPLKQIDIDGENIDIPKEYQGVPGEKGGLAEIPADLVFANTIPVKHMSIMPRLYKGDQIIDYYTIHFHDDTIRNNNIFKMLSGETNEASIGWMEHRLDCSMATIKGWIKYYVEIMLKANEDSFAMNKVIYYDCSENLRETVNKINSSPELWFPKYFEENQVNMEVLAAWYTLQECILHDELRIFVKKAKVEKPTVKKPSKKSMNNKKYVQRYYIQLQQLFNEYDINNIENTDNSDKYKKKKALWHVAGHWRHYKSGKRIFIQGYWKGVQRNSNTNTLHTPIEISMDNFKDILNSQG
jgi:hypothetical protein